MAPLTLLGSFDVALITPVGDEQETLPGTLVQMTGRTVSIDMGTGSAALTVSIAPQSILVFGDRGQERCALVHPGRRSDDVHSPTTIELVLDDVAPLEELERELAESAETLDLAYGNPADTARTDGDGAGGERPRP